ncbi:hypothetical protein [Caulobacter sp. 17J65-9]|uniref:hypothetical protein n=1 Tax=Caulobacter sp. 17J65-9 TaxID=2709382 RepID=UPI0013C5738D|nr:hypothetical protein [Caulobacter sp. 17J65-9]NEX93051.1 hypothetical protein [Caulobacter sp. 17J65-9]
MSTEALRPARNPAFTVITAGLLGGAGDITYAIVFHGLRGVAPERIFQSVASGVFGKASFQGGMATAAAGAALHFFISIVAAGVFYMAATRVRALVRYPVIFGPLFGLAMWLAMNFVIVPLSAARTPTFDDTFRVMTDIMSHVFLFGLPIALVTRAGLKD